MIRIFQYRKNKVEKRTSIGKHKTKEQAQEKELEKVSWSRMRMENTIGYPPKIETLN